MSDAHLTIAIKYVEQNPVRAKMVKEAWKEFSSSSIDNIDDLRVKTRTWRPMGDENFYELDETISGRDLKPKKAGRHKSK